ncbi:MAG: HAD family hydrolase [Inquilinaceae bacterium]
MDLIIFDCDGVLVDSEVIAARVVADHLAALLPGSIDPDTLQARFAGMSDAAMFRALSDEHDVVFPDDFHDRIRKSTDRALADELNPIQGVADALAGLTLPMAVASNSRVARLRQSLKTTDLAHLFGDRLFGADLVDRPKPAPDIYLLAARTMGTAPSRCLVVEDSVPGVTAAVAAGMTVIGFLGAGHIRPGHDRRLQDAGAVTAIDHMNALAATIDRLSRSTAPAAS